MSEHNYTSLKDLLKDHPPPPKIGLAAGNEDDDSAAEEVEIPPVTEFFGELYFKERSSTSPSQRSSLDYLKFSPPLPKVSSNPKNNIDENELIMMMSAARDDDDNEKNVAKNDSCTYNNSSKLFPPPISTLKIVSKTSGDQRFTYRRFDEETKAFVDETITLRPPEGTSGALMAASRENIGRSRMMKFADDDRDDYDEGEASKSPPSDD